MYYTNPTEQKFTIAKLPMASEKELIDMANQVQQQMIAFDEKYKQGDSIPVAESQYAESLFKQMQDISSEIAKRFRLQARDYGSRYLYLAYLSSLSVSAYGAYDFSRKRSKREPFTQSLLMFGGLVGFEAIRRSKEGIVESLMSNKFKSLVSSLPKYLQPYVQNIGIYS